MIFHPKGHEYETADPRHFTGSARVARMLGVATNPEVNVYRVIFAAHARTAWHVHSGTQLLVVLEGECLLVMHGQGIQVISAGGAVVIPPGEKHWHGAPPLTQMTHLAINGNATTKWLELVTDKDYGLYTSEFFRE